MSPIGNRQRGGALRFAGCQLVTQQITNLRYRSSPAQRPRIAHVAFVEIHIILRQIAGIHHRIPIFLRAAHF